MRAVFSAMRRSLTSAATRFASSKRGVRSTSRAVSRTAIPPTRRVSIWGRSSNVMVGSSGLEKQEGKPARRLPLLEPLGSTGSTGVPADLGMIHRLFGRRLHRYNGDVGAALSLGTVRHAPIDQRKQRVIPAQANVFARMPFGSMLPHNDIAGTTRLAAEQLDAEALARGIAAVTRGAACFLVRHGGLPSRTRAERRAGSLPHPTLPLAGEGRVGEATGRNEP